MKIRSDFVSNSSSSSFIVACNGKNISHVLKDIAKSCSNAKYRYHDKHLHKKNLLALEFCTSIYQLLFLGELVVKTEKKKYSVKSFKRTYKNYRQKDDYIKVFDRYVKNVKLAKEENCDKYIKQMYGRDYQIDDNTYMHFNDITASQIAISNYVMTYLLYRYHFKDKDGNETKDDDRTIKNRIETILKIASASTSYQSRVEIYSITLDTIANTRELIDFGYAISFDEWEDLDALEKRLMSGEKLFYVRQAHDGDGYGDFYIYCEDGAPGITNVKDIEVLGGECL